MIPAIGFCESKIVNWFNTSKGFMENQNLIILIYCIFSKVTWPNLIF